MLHGGMDTDERAGDQGGVPGRPGASRPSGSCSATDAASEGINLQNHCHRLLHYEIPWNPNRLEQRNGRVDRHGQTRSRGARLPLRPEGLRPSWMHVDDVPVGDLEGDLEFLAPRGRQGRADPRDARQGRAGDRRPGRRRRCSATGAGSTPTRPKRRARRSAAARVRAQARGGAPARSRSRTTRRAPSYD